MVDSSLVGRELKPVASSDLRASPSRGGRILRFLPFTGRQNFRILLFKGIKNFTILPLQGDAEFYDPSPSRGGLGWGWVIEKELTTFPSAEREH